MTRSLRSTALRFSAAVAFSVAASASQGGGAASATNTLAERMNKIAGELRAVGVPVDTAKLTVDARKPKEILPDLVKQNLRVFGEDWFEALWVTLKALGQPVEDTPAEFQKSYLRATIGPQGAWYFADSKSLAIDARQMTDSAETDRILAHELTHAAQDQREGFVAIFSRLGSTTDGIVRARCLTEGEAECSSRLVMLARGGRTADLIPLFGSVTTEEERQGGMLLHYGAGRAFVCRRFAHGGWKEALERIAKPPASTEQLAHDDKLDLDLPVAVELPAWPANLGEARLVREDTHGELGVRMLLAMARIPAAQADPAAIGWDGDRLRVWRTKDGKFALAWRTVWDRDEDAEQFQKVLATVAQGKIVSRKRCVDWTWAEDGAVAEALASALAALEPPASGGDADAKSTEAAERDWSARQPRLETGQWIVPDFFLRVPAPEEWVQEEAQGMIVLMRGTQVEDGFRDNLTLSRAPAEASGSAEVEVEALRAALAGTRGVSVIRVERFQLEKEDAVIAEYVLATPARELHALEIWCRRGSERLSLTATVLEKRWKDVGPGIETMFRGIRLATTPAPARPRGG